MTKMHIVLKDKSEMNFDNVTAHGIDNGLLVVMAGKRTFVFNPLVVAWYSSEPIGPVEAKP